MDHVWAWDFVFDRTANGRPIRWLSIVDEYTRERLALEVDRNMTSEDVLDVLRDLFVIRGVPKHIRGDNGPEFIAHAIRRFLAAAGWRRCTSSRDRRGRTAMPRAFIAACGASFWTRKSLRMS